MSSRLACIVLIACVVAGCAEVKAPDNCVTSPCASAADMSAAPDLAEATADLSLAAPMPDLALPRDLSAQPSPDLSSGSDLAMPPADLSSSCSHSTCSTGAKLVSGCDPCATQICASDSYCCQTSWNYICVNEVSSICHQTCP
jgi:hypothetical protein